MWDNARALPHISTGSKKQKVSVYLIAWKVVALTPSPLALTPGPSQPRHVTRPLRHRYAASDSHSHLRSHQPKTRRSPRVADRARAGVGLRVRTEIAIKLG